MTEVQDTGTGIPEALLPKVFDPFVTTKPVDTARDWAWRWSRKLSTFTAERLTSETPRREVCG